LLLAVVALAACVNSGGGYPKPGFVGVPEAIERSPDFELPLSIDGADRLRRFLALRGDRIEFEDEDTEPTRDELGSVAKSYGEVLARLDAPITTSDMKEGTPVVALFDADLGIFTVHDARVGRDAGSFVDLVGQDAVALVHEDYVFAFYLRRLEGVETAEGTVWRQTGEPLEGEGPWTYTGLVVFPRAFAVPEVPR
jgi:hypothetical protein